MSRPAFLILIALLAVSCSREPIQQIDNVNYIAEVVKLEAGHMALCLNMTSSARDECIHYVSANLNLSGFCDKINDPYYKYGCTMDQLLVSGTPNDCSRLNDSYNLWCIGDFAVRDSDPEACNLLMEYKKVSTHGGTNWTMLPLRPYCIIKVAVNTSNWSLCLTLEEAKLRDDCLSAVHNPNQALDCDLFTSAERKSSCLYWTAYYTTNATICPLIDDIDYRVHCYNEMAKTINDSSYCGFIDDAESRDSCYYHTSQDDLDPNLCSFINDTEMRENCLMFKAEDLLNISLCDGLSIRDGCLSEVIKEKAYRLGSGSDGCAELGKYDADNCYLGVAYATNESSHCEFINDSEESDFCFLGMADILDRIELCGRIAHRLNRQKCMSDLVARAGNISGCSIFDNEILIPSYRDACLLNIALNTSNLTICEELPESYRQQCYSKIGIQINDASLCERFNSSIDGNAEIYRYRYQTRDNCLFSIAKDTGDWSLCNRINSSQDKDSCLLDGLKSLE